MSTRNARGRANGRNDRIKRLLDSRVKALRQQLPHAIEGDDRAVHQARVASRRLREAVPVLGTSANGRARKASRKIRKLTQALGSVRELDVTMHLIDELAASDDLSKPALQDVKLHVDEERKRRRDAMLDRLSNDRLEKLHRRIDAATEAIIESRDERWRRTLAARLVKRARWLAETIEAAGPLYAPEHLHQVRIAAKKLRYGLELAADVRVGGAAALVRSLKKAQDILGRLHDLQVLQQHVAAVQVAAPGRAVPHPGLAAIAGRIEEQCRIQHGKYVAMTPRLREVAASVRTDVVPRLAKPSRALKMSLRRNGRAARSAR